VIVIQSRCRLTPEWLKRAKARPEVSTGRRKGIPADLVAVQRSIESMQHTDGTTHKRLYEGGVLNERQLLDDKGVMAHAAKDCEPKSIYSPAPTPRLRFMRPKKRVPGLRLPEMEQGTGVPLMQSTSREVLTGYIDKVETIMDRSKAPQRLQPRLDIARDNLTRV